VTATDPAPSWLSAAAPRVLTVGIHILDVLGRPVDRLPPGQSSVTLEEIRLTAAGTAAGTAVDLAKLGAKVTTVGAIGDDAAGRLVLDLMRGHGVDVSRMVVLADRPTAVTILPIRPNGERPALHVRGAGSMMAEDLGDEIAIEEFELLHLGGPDALGAFGRAPAAKLLERAKAAGLTTSLDLLRPGDVQSFEVLRPLLAQTDYFLPNIEQLLGMFGIYHDAEAASRILDLGVKAVAVSHGELGCAVFSQHEHFRLPAADVAVVDTTGCGDAFSAGFLRAVSSGAELEQAAWVATAAAALVAQGLGSDAGIIDLPTTIDTLSTTRWHDLQASDGRQAPPPALRSKGASG
jgi:sugar/nucleoside kinase (ribokinase family)